MSADHDLRKLRKALVEATGERYQLRIDSGDMEIEDLVTLAGAWQRKYLETLSEDDLLKEVAGEVEMRQDHRGQLEPQPLLQAALTRAASIKVLASYQDPKPPRAKTMASAKQRKRS
jgi:hypothetical protein